MLLSLFVSTAHAMAARQGGAAPQEGSMLTSLLPLVIIFAILYFLMIRPQQKQQKKHREMVAAMKKGDKVVTRGGMYGTVYGLTDTTVTLEVANDVKIKFARDAVSTVISSESELVPAETKS